MQAMTNRRKVLLSGLMAPLAAIAQSEDASSLLARAKQRYFDLKTYQDRGSVRFEILGVEEKVDFATAYVRPNSFRFDWSKGHPFPPLRHFVTRSAIWSDGEAAYTWKKPPHKAPVERKESSLAMAVAGATGVSSRSAHVIATLLIADLWGAEPFGDSILNLKGARLIGKESVDGVECYRVKGMDWRDEPIELWLGKEDLILRRNERVNSGSKFIEERTGIVIDGSIPASHFRSPSQTLA
jgi:hypothetical protein